MGKYNDTLAPHEVPRSTKYIEMVYNREYKVLHIYRTDRKTGEVRHMKLLKGEMGIVSRFIFSMFQKPPLRK
jgi:hypothetical protein